MSNVNPAPTATKSGIGYSWSGMEGQRTTLVIRADHAELIETPHPDVPETTEVVTIPKAREIFLAMRRAEEAGGVFPMSEFTA